MNDIAAASPLMEVIHILCHNRHSMLFFKLCHKLVSKARLHIEQLLAPCIIELRHELRVASPAFWRRDILHIVLFPKTATIAKGTDATFGAHTRSCQDNNSHICPFFG